VRRVPSSGPGEEAPAAAQPAHAILSHKAIPGRRCTNCVEKQIAEVLQRASGADRQRAVFERTGQLADVVADLARVTAGQDAL
jgi:hypothetical protein